jgi:hydrogenase maturation protein HypF
MADTGTSRPVSVRVTIEGIVQGVGFRPFLFGLAREHHVEGWVRNTSSGIEAGLKGDERSVARMLRDIELRKPQPAELVSMRVVPVAAAPDSGFRIESSVDSEARARIAADKAPCPDCLADMADPASRRHHYAFTTCSACGPRFSIAAGIRFDRALTSMSDFAMCADCRREYASPSDRRFHAQTLSCPECGPQLSARDGQGQRATGYAAVLAAVERIAAGRIVAIKGVGGFQWVCDATNAAAVAELRRIKHRPDKPFALMVPDLALARSMCALGAREEQSLLSAGAPIVLAARRESGYVARRLARGISDPFPLRGVMLPPSPLHSLLLEAWGQALVATSANLPGEPMIIDDAEAEALLSAETDLVLTHDRRIVHRVDDPVVRIIAGAQTLLRNGRGFAPIYLPAPPERDVPIMLALGGHLKSSFALATPAYVALSQHIGDLDSVAATEFLRAEIDASLRTGRHEPGLVLGDAHPDSGTVSAWDGQVAAVQHHKAHVLSAAFEHGFSGRALGIAWDGLGFGEDGRLWGGEAFVLDTGAARLERVASLLPFALPGGDRAAREPWRPALAVAERLFGGDYEDALRRRGLGHCLDAVTAEQRPWLQRELVRAGRLETTSVGRLFDALCSFLDLKQRCSFEGQGAMLVEGLALAAPDLALSLTQTWPELESVDCSPGNGLELIDWRPAMRVWLDALAAGVPASEVALRFHHFLASVVCTLAQSMGQRTVLLSGGVFQNKVLTELTTALAGANGIDVLCQHRIPPNDGGLAIGQLAHRFYRIGD